MGLAHSPRIATDGLVFALDAANRKSFDPRENLYPHSETLQTLSNTRCSREVFTSGGPLGRGYVEFTVTETSSFVYNFDSGNTISLTAGDIITFSILFQNVDVSGSINLRCWGGSGRAWSTTRQVTYNLANLTSSPSSGTILDHFITSEGSGWYRLSMTVQADRTGFSAISTIFNATIGEKYRVTAVQVETGEYHNGYLQTDGTAITRSNTVNDLSGQNNSGTLTNGPTFDSANLGSIAFDGVNDFFNMTSNFSVAGVTNYSASLWLNLNSSTTGVDVRFFWHGNYGVLVYKNTANSLFFYLRTTDATIQKSTSFSSFIGAWTNIAVTYDGITMRLYVNGDLKSSGSHSGGIIDNNPTRFLLGGSSNGYFTACKMTGVLVYNRALSASEIAQNFNAKRGRFGI